MIVNFSLFSFIRAHLGLPQLVGTLPIHSVSLHFTGNRYSFVFYGIFSNNPMLPMDIKVVFSYPRSIAPLFSAQSFHAKFTFRIYRSAYLFRPIRPLECKWAANRTVYTKHAAHFLTSISDPVTNMILCRNENVPVHLFSKWKSLKFMVFVCFSPHAKCPHSSLKYRQIRQLKLFSPAVFSFNVKSKTLICD